MVHNDHPRNEEKGVHMLKKMCARICSFVTGSVVICLLGVFVFCPLVRASESFGSTPFIGVVNGSQVNIRTGGSKNHGAFSTLSIIYVRKRNNSEL